MAEVIGASDDNKASRRNSSPWPDVESGAIAFLLDARDDFEAGLLRDWVESRKPDGGSHPQHAFIRLTKNGAENLLGYAEADPTFDVGGFDTAHKLSLLTTLAFGTQVAFDQVHVEGIEGITPADIEAADAWSLFHEQGGDPSRFTISSDGGGCLPVFR